MAGSVIYGKTRVSYDTWYTNVAVSRDILS